VKVSGEKSFDAPRSVVWEVLNDPERMAKLMPGIESFDIADKHNWSARVKVPLGLGAIPISFSFEKTDEREPEYARLVAKGKGVGAIVSMDTQFNLSEAAGGTAMQWEADVSIAGPVGSMGQRVLQPIVNQQVGNVLSALEKQVADAAGSKSGSPGAGSVGESGSSQGGSAGESGSAGGGSANETGGPGQAGGGADDGNSGDDVPGPGGAEEGIHPASPETYSDDPEGPTHSTRDDG
jgi:carbon monoxide dehydrogenase subunit G